MYGCTSINCGVFLKTIDTPKIDNVLKIYFDVSLFRYLHGVLHGVQKNRIRFQNTITRKIARKPNFFTY